MHLSPGAQRLLDALKDYTCRYDRVFPFQKTLAEKLRCSIQTIRRWVAELKKAGAVAVKKCGRTSATYTLVKSFLEQQIKAVRGLREVIKRSGVAHPYSSVKSYIKKQYTAWNPPRRKPPEREASYIRPEKLILADQLIREQQQRFGGRCYDDFLEVYGAELRRQQAAIATA